MHRLFFTLLLLSLLPVASCLSDDSPKPFNIILVFIDDMGWGDFSCFGNEDADTPHIDRLAAEGIRYEQFYVNSPICSPSRVAISTGTYPQRWGITSYLSNRNHNQARGMEQWLSPDAPMLSRQLQQAGYATGHFGKWHMGGQRDVNDAPPIQAYGFDAALTNFEGMGPKLLPLTLKPGQGPEKPGRIWHHAEILGEGYRWMQRSEITAGFVEAAVDFIDEAQQANKPFYVNLWPDDVHTPFWPPVETWGDGSKRQLFLSVLETMDSQLGVLFDRIHSDETLRNNTLILACSDNGPEQGAGVAGPFRGYKTHLYEGGIRSSLVAWGPGILDAEGRVDDSSVFSAIDLVPTLLDLTGTAHATDVQLDGESLPDIFSAKGQSRQAPIYFRRPPDRDSFYGVADLPDLAVRSGKWKLTCEYDESDVQLFDMETDPGETRNLAAEHSDIAADLSSVLVKWHLSMPADNGATYKDPPRKPKTTKKK